ncbi:response regulator [bacterium]|nr:response regulator [bacterium]RQV97804.1 MAG: response regulator [bacterium]
MVISKKINRILVAEDENIIAMEIKDRLEGMGYDVPALATNKREIIEKVADLQPDLVLMDIMLDGHMDGVDAAEEIRTRFDIPVVYLTAYSDENTLQRVKITEPYGYILKPLDERELRNTIEIALYKHWMEQKVKEDEQRFHTTLKSIGDAVITTDVKGRITFLNSVAESLTGWKQEKASGKRVNTIFKIVNAKTGSVAKNPVDMVLQKGVVYTLSDNCILISKDGNEIPIDDSAAPIKDDKDQIRGVVLVFRDITERKRLEEHLRQSQKMEAVGTLASGVAHDFNNIMTIIQVSADLAMVDVKESDPIFQSLVEIQESAERASDLTRKLLYFSRKQPMEYKSVNVNETIEGLLYMVMRLLEGKITINTIFESELNPIRADLRSIEQVLINIIINARDAMPDGGQINIRTENKILNSKDCEHMSESRPGEYVCISISDHGSGMDGETLQHIFEPFFSTKGQGKGTGLGLSVVYGIIKQHNGWIDVKSKLNRGSEFKIYLPTAREESSGDEVERDTFKSLKGSGERILLVDDEDSILEYVDKALTRCGYRIYPVSNSKEALNVFKKEKGNFNLLLSDVVLPDQDGVELAYQLLNYNPNLPVLLSSGYYDCYTRYPAIQDNEFPFLQKPYTLNDLLHMIRSTMEQ